MKAHHRISWLHGGNTDLENLILLCQFHHTRVHEDQITIDVCNEPDCRIPWRFVRADGSTIKPVVAGLNAPSPWRPDREQETQALHDQAAQLRTAYDHIHDDRHPDARRVFPVGGGEGFNLINCVDALFHFTEPLSTAA